MISEKVIIAGFGGQGVMLMGQLLSYTATAKDLNTKVEFSNLINNGNAVVGEGAEAAIGE